MVRRKREQSAGLSGPVGVRQTQQQVLIISSTSFDAVLFDMDGVVTKTAIIHTAAWKEVFDQLLKANASSFADFVPFSEEDYLKYVDGKKREDGIQSFIESRKITLPLGSINDEPGLSSVYALGNLKNAKFLELLHEHGVEPYETTVAFIRSLKAAGLKPAIITSSKNGQEILQAAHLTHLFDARVDGMDAERSGLAGKPYPDTFLEAARMLSVAPERAVVIEDAAAGVEAGRNGKFGLVVGVARQDNVDLLKQHGADVVVRDLAELQVDADTSQAMPGMALAELHVSDRNWVLAYESFVPDLEGQRETLCALGNGYFSTRAAAPESQDDGVHYPGTYLAGGYNRIGFQVEDEHLEQDQLVNMPNWLSLTFKLNDGDWFYLSRVNILHYHQHLDLREGVLYRVIRFRDEMERESTVSQRSFVHMRYSHLAGLETTWEAHNWSGTITIRTGLDGSVVNNGVRLDPSIRKKHLETLAATASGDIICLQVMTSQSQVVVVEASRNVLLHESGNDGKPSTSSVERLNIIDREYVGQQIVASISQGQTIKLQKTVALYSSRDRGISQPQSAAIQAVNDAPGFDVLVEDQCNVWLNLWRQFDLFVDTTEAHSKIVPSLLLHLNCFHAIQTASPNTIDFDTGVPARGWTGEGYQGHIFWDDLFVFPFINLRMPNITEALLKYRYRRLDAARKIATSMGARGARFPWQSGSDGSEETPRYDWSMKKHTWLADHSASQVHVNAAIAYNIWQYYQVTENLDFVHAYGAEMLFEIARFFASFAKYNSKRERYEIRGVIGPDEYHTAYVGADHPGINNNAYTNVMAVWTISRALDLLKLMPPDHREQICQNLKISLAETALWERVSRNMYVPFCSNGMISEFEGFDELQDFPWFKNGKLDVDKLKGVLEEQDGHLNQYKVCKQADVLMLFYVFSTEELQELFHRLGYQFEPDDIRKNIEFYVPRTANDSTLSRVAHAWVLSRLDRFAAWKLLASCHRQNVIFNHNEPHPMKSWDVFMEALRSDFADSRAGTTREGIHMGAMAGTIDIVQRCYTGIVTRDDVLWLSPQLPDALSRLSFSVHYRGQALRIEITQRTMKITARHSSAHAIKIGFRGQVYNLGAGDSRLFDLANRQVLWQQAS